MIGRRQRGAGARESHENKPILRSQAETGWMVRIDLPTEIVCHAVLEKGKAPIHSETRGIASRVSAQGAAATRRLSTVNVWTVQHRPGQVEAGGYAKREWVP